MGQQQSFAILSLGRLVPATSGHKNRPNYAVFNVSFRPEAVVSANVLMQQRAFNIAASISTSMARRLVDCPTNNKGQDLQVPPFQASTPKEFEAGPQ